MASKSQKNLMFCVPGTKNQFNEKAAGFLEGLSELGVALGMQPNAFSIVEIAEHEDAGRPEVHVEVTAKGLTQKRVDILAAASARLGMPMGVKPTIQ